MHFAHIKMFFVLTPYHLFTFRLHTNITQARYVLTCFVYDRNY